MNKFNRTIALACVGIVGFFLLLGLAGRADYKDQVILRMSQEEYDAIKQDLTQVNGCEPSEYEIADRWVQNNK